jgi:hypothetical protein
VTEERATRCGSWVSPGGDDNTELEIVGCRVVDGSGNSDHRRSSRSGGGSMVGSG